MRVLIACEFSGVVRRAFVERGHTAISVDLLDAEDSEWLYAHYGRAQHRKGDALAWLQAEAEEFGAFDLLIAHPPCQYLANSGVRWLYKGGRGKVRDMQRWRDMRAAREFFLALWNTRHARAVAIENPIQHAHAKLPAPTQIVQPWWFGHGETKATCLWLRNLPQLVPTRRVSGRTPRVHHASPGPERWKERSRTLPGFARAMAEQWGNK